MRQRLPVLNIGSPAPKLVTKKNRIKLRKWSVFYLLILASPLVYYCQCTRVQWFWHFFRNSICFLCFWFGLEILRLVKKKCFLKYWSDWSYLTLHPSKKTLTRVEKKFLRNWACRVSKEAEFCTDSKMCRTLASRSSQRFFLRKPIFCKIFQVPKNLLFSKDKRSNKIETVQYFKKHFFIN